MKTSPRPELREPVLAFAERLERGEPRIPLADLAALFGAPGEVLGLVAGRGDLVFLPERFSNDGPELSVEAGRVELELPSLIRGTWEAAAGGFRLTFPLGEYAPRACVRIALFRKCFELKEMRASGRDLTLDFGNELADRCYTF